jgi:hypothetical protein
MSKAVGEHEVVQLADWAVETQREHFDGATAVSSSPSNRRRSD